MTTIMMMKMTKNPFLELKKCSDRLYKLSKYKAKSTKQFQWTAKVASAEIDRIQAYLDKIKKFSDAYIDKDFIADAYDR